MRSLPPLRRRFIACGLALSLASCFSGAAYAEWVVEPVDLTGNAGWSINLDVDSAGQPHAAYYTQGGNWKYKVRREGAWTDRTSVPSGDAFALDHNDDPFFISTPGPSFFPQFQILLDNNLLLGQQLFAGRISEDVRLEFDSQNRPHVAYVDTAARQLKHATWNGAQWATRTVATGPEFQYGNWDFSATLDTADAMHFAWQNTSDVLRYARPNATSWTLSSPFGSANTRPYDLDVDAAGNVHLAYDVHTGSVFTGGLFYAKHDGASWSSGRVSGLENFGVGRTQIVTDDDGRPHLFTYDGVFLGPDVLKHVFQEGGVWTNEPLDSRTSSSSGPDSIEAVYADGGFHVLFSTGDAEIYYAYEQAPHDPADFNGNGIPDGDDLAMWSQHFGTDSGVGDADADGDADGVDMLLWQRSLRPASAPVARAIPEPASAQVMLAISLLALGRRRLGASR